MFNTTVRAGPVGAGAASRYGSGSGSDQKMRLRLSNTGINYRYIIYKFHYLKFNFCHVWDPRSGIRKKFILDPGSLG
jgi:hypothetical protein